MTAILSGCEDFGTADRAQSADRLEGWRARTILGGGDGSHIRSNQGLVTGGQQVKAGQGTIFPGRQPLVRDSDFVNDNGERTVSLNLVDVSIEDAAAAILGELLSENYVIDPGISGTVNIRSSQPVSRTTAIEVFELALEQNNAALIRRGEVFAIVPISDNLTLGATTARDVLPGYTLRVIPLRNIGAQEMAAILQPFAGDGIVGIDAQRNIIVLAGTSADQRAWQETIDSFDVDWLANRSVGIFPIKGRSAQSIVNGLERVVETDEAFEPLAVFEVIPENNSILVVAKTPRALENIAVWIKRLTQQSANDAQIYSYDMKYARASTIAPTLAQILGIQVETATDETALEEVVEELDAAGSPAATGDVNATRVVASAATNTLLIYATPDEYERILGVLHRLDVPPRQVLVEATIVEVSLNENLRYGVQYFFQDDGDSVGLSRGETQAISPELPGFSLVIDTPPNVIVDALDDVTSINVVSSPNLMILNNESARLVVGDQVPVATQQAQDALNEDAVILETVEFRDTGVIFEVTPRINSSGSVVLNINQEVSTVQAAEADTLTPTISQRVISSSVAVDSGETIVLGGLFENEATRGNSGVPILKDIPVAGRLFGRNSRSTGQTELLVLITPRIVNNAMDARRVTRQLRERVNAIRLDDASLSTAIDVPETRTRNSALISAKAVPQGTTSAAAAPAPAPAAAPAPAVASAAPAPSAGGTHYAVLGSFSTESAAKSHWSSLVSRNQGVLGSVAPRFSRTGNLTTVSVGPLSSAAATKLCVDIKADCFTTKR